MTHIYVKCCWRVRILYFSRKGICDLKMLYTGTRKIRNIILMTFDVKTLENMVSTVTEFYNFSTDISQN
jgi:hypothetical protein